MLHRRPKGVQVDEVEAALQHHHVAIFIQGHDGGGRGGERRSRVMAGVLKTGGRLVHVEAIFSAIIHLMMGRNSSSRMCLSRFHSRARVRVFLSVCYTQRVPSLTYQSLESLLVIFTEEDADFGRKNLFPSHATDSRCRESIQSLNLTHRCV